ncbi:MAG: EamA family transporter [Peptococcaceae bacterium]|nr:EamA family transporter [Peptococcaceae bacterium]
MKNFAILLPLIAGILWGSVGVFVRKLTAFGMSNYTILSTRVLGAAILLFIGILVYNKSLLRIKIKDIWIFLGCGVIAMLGLNYCYTEAINSLSLSLAAVLLSLSPVFVIFIATIVFKESITKRKIVCTLIAFLGCLMVSGILESNGLTWSGFGIFVGTLAAVFYALYSILSKLAMERKYSVFTTIFYSVLFMGIVLIPFTDWHTVVAFAAAEPLSNVAFMILHSLCANVLPYVVYTFSLNYVEAGNASIVAAAGEPSAAMLFGIMFFSEIPSFLGVTGLVITIIGITLLSAPERGKDTPKTKL